MRGKAHDDRGSSVVEFVLVVVLLVLLLFAVLQVAVWFYARSIVASATADAAHYSATVGGTATAGELRARQLIGDGLDGRVTRDISCTDVAGVDAGSGLPITTVRCSGRPHMLFLPFDVPLDIDVRSSVLTEPTP